MDGCGCGAGTIWEPRNGNIHRWKLVQRSGVGQQTGKTQCVCVNCRKIVCEIAIAL
jgi:hypothetical protein